MIRIHEKIFDVFIDSVEINECVDRIASEINFDYISKTPLFLAVLNGAFMFASDLMKKINMPSEIEFIKVSSYEGTETTGKVKKLIGLSKAVKGRDLIILEDIIDSGHTIKALYNLLEKLEPSSIKTASLLFKPKAYQENIKINYIGKEISNDFVVGYGLDYNGLGRNLNEIYKLKIA